MRIRRWLRRRMLGAEAEGHDVPPGVSLIDTLLGRGQDRVRSLGEFDRRSYPSELSDLLRRRASVAADLLEIDVADPDTRIAAIPRLQQLLLVYPHPLVYETLIHAYVDAGRPDQARGVAFAARERRLECERSPHPEIRAETDRLRAWTAAEVDELGSRRKRIVAEPE